MPENTVGLARRHKQPKTRATPHPEIATMGQPVRKQKNLLLKNLWQALLGAYAITSPVLPTLPPVAG